MTNKVNDYILDSIAMFKKRMSLFHRMDGDMNRWDFLKFFWVAQVITIVLSLATAAIGLTYGWVLVHLVLFVPLVVAMIERVKDMGISPWFVLIILVSIGGFPIGWLIMVFMCNLVPTDAFKLDKYKGIK